MSVIEVRNESRWLFNPWSIFLRTYQDPIGSQPTNPAFFTEGAIGISPIEEFVGAEGYKNCSGVRYKLRNDLIRFSLTITYQIKEFIIESMQHVYGGTVQSDGATLVFDGTAPPYFSLWAETCYNDDSKIVRLTIPKGKSTATAVFTTGDTHLLIPTTFEALPDIDDDTTLPNLYFQP